MSPRQRKRRQTRSTRNRKREVRARRTRDTSPSASDSDATSSSSSSESEMEFGRRARRASLRMEKKDHNLVLEFIVYLQQKMPDLAPDDLADLARQTDLNKVKYGVNFYDELQKYRVIRNKGVESSIENSPTNYSRGQRERMLFAEFKSTSYKKPLERILQANVDQIIEEVFSQMEDEKLDLFRKFHEAWLKRFTEKKKRRPVRRRSQGRRNYVNNDDDDEAETEEVESSSS